MTYTRDFTVSQCILPLPQCHIKALEPSPVSSHILHQGTQYDHTYYTKGPSMITYTTSKDQCCIHTNTLRSTYDPTIIFGRHGNHHIYISLCEGYRSFISWWLTLLHYRKCNMITWATFEYKDHLASYDVSRDKQLWDHVFFIMEITSVVRWHLHIGTYPWVSSM